MEPSRLIGNYSAKIIYAECLKFVEVFFRREKFGLVIMEITIHWRQNGEIIENINGIIYYRCKKKLALTVTSIHKQNTNRKFGYIVVN